MSDWRLNILVVLAWFITIIWGSEVIIGFTVEHFSFEPMLDIPFIIGIIFFAIIGFFAGFEPSGRQQ